MMIGSGKSDIKMGVSSVTVMMVGMVWLSILTMPTSAQVNSAEALGLPDCWAKMVNCIATAGINYLDPKADYGICCPVIKTQVANTTCFCSIKEFTENMNTDQPSVAASETELSANKLLAGCKMDTTYDQLCTAATTTSSVESANGTASGSLPGFAKNGAVKIASVGLLPGASVAWIMMMMMILS